MGQNHTIPPLYVLNRINLVYALNGIFWLVNRGSLGVRSKRNGSRKRVGSVTFANRHRHVIQ